MIGMMIKTLGVIIAGTALAGSAGECSTDCGAAPEKAEDVSPLRVGEKVPDTELDKADGSSIRLRSRLKGRRAVLIFYRGGWCPYCSIHLAELQKIESDLKDLGYELLAISPDRPELIAAGEEKEGLDYELLSDSDMAAAKAFGIAFRVDDATIEKYKDYDIDLERTSGRDHHLLPVPAVFLVDAECTIRFSYSNPDYKIRITPDELLKAAREFSASYEKSEDEREGVDI